MAGMNLAQWHDVSASAMLQENDYVKIPAEASLEGG